MYLLKEIEKSFPILEKLFSVDELLSFINGEYSKLYNYHFGLGLWIRNNLLVESTPMYIEFIRHKITIKDDMSDLVLKLFYVYIQSKNDT